MIIIVIITITECHRSGLTFVRGFSCPRKFPPPSSRQHNGPVNIAACDGRDTGTDWEYTYLHIYVCACLCVCVFTYYKRIRTFEKRIKNVNKKIRRKIKNRTRRFVSPFFYFLNNARTSSRNFGRRIWRVQTKHVCDWYFVFPGLRCDSFGRTTLPVCASRKTTRKNQQNKTKRRNGKEKTGRDVRARILAYMHTRAYIRTRMSPRTRKHRIPLTNHDDRRKDGLHCSSFQ